METLEELDVRIGEIRSRIQEIDLEHDGSTLPAEARSEWNTLNEELEEKSKLKEELEQRKARVAELAGNGQAREAGFNIGSTRNSSEDIYDLSTIRSPLTDPERGVSELRDRARKAVERADYPSDGVDPAESQEQVERLLKSRDDEGALAKRVLLTGSEQYQRAFGKAMTSQPLTNEEARALAVAQRALSTSDTGGGYAIPFTLDPSVILTSNHSVNPFRAISRVEQVTTDNWNGVTSAGVSASYAAEAAEASDNAPTLGQPSIAVEKAHVFIPFSIEVGQDWTGLRSEVAMMIQESKDDLEATKFVSGAGSGSDEPQGVLVGGTVTYTTAASAALGVADIYGVEGALPPRFRPRASWIANRVQYNRVRQFDTGGGAQLWTDNLRVGLANQGPTPGNIGQSLIGYPAHEVSTMGTTVTAGHTVAVFGDFSRYVIVDRVGMNLELIPHLFGTASNYPTGQRGIYAWWRNSAEVVDANAFRKIITASS